ncbi:hypothetical protein [Pelagibius sp. Alg239-R121]|uniref:hypothetical protein n=1 Tax=Pelagibius sp. Alg239-R121 TaxID=2993448 RepID=UPI0024A6E359|nr:hypothetical protein [Pelagibius sp. Alg239-R121]
MVNLNARLLPLDRSDLYEIPLDDFMEANGLGMVDMDEPAGSKMDEKGEVLNCHFSLRLTEVSDQVLEKITRYLEGCGAPRGSFLVLSDDRKIPFGVNEGLAIYIDASGSSDGDAWQGEIEKLRNELTQLLESDGQVQSSRELPNETALYLYGPSLDGMTTRVSPFLESAPLSNTARLEKIA